MDRVQRLFISQQLRVSNESARTIAKKSSRKKEVAADPADWKSLISRRDELVKEARTLAGGNVPFSDYIKKWEGKGGTEVLIKSRSQGKPSNITDEQWNAMSDEDKRLFQ